MIKKEKNKNKDFKSQILVIGSFLILIGLFIIGYHIYSDYNLKRIEKDNVQEFFEEEQVVEDITQENKFVEVENKNISKTNYNYIAVLEIPKINIKRGLSQEKYYNNVNRNVEILKGSDMPNISKGNFILAGHSGSGRVSYFKNLDKLVIGDISYIYYGGIKYTYKVTNIYDIEKKGTLENYVDDKIKNKKILINLIKKYSKGNKLIESGSGTGVLSTYMSSLGYEVTGIDIDNDILNLSKKIANKYNSKNKPTFKNKSIFKLDYEENYFDVSFSNGVLEHFNDEQIIDTLKQQMKIAKIVIFGIPTKYFNQEEAMYGDERYKSNVFWRNLINMSGGIILEEKSMHYMSRMKRLLNYKKYFRPYPYRIFVIKSD